MRKCIAVCGLAAADGDVYCQGCRESIDCGRALGTLETGHGDGLS